jgi:HSP20 family protein
MAKRTRGGSAGGPGSGSLGGFFGGLGNLIEKLGELAETGKELSQTGELRGPEGKRRGIYGFNIKVGIGGDELRVEPFGNVRCDEQTGRAVVHEIREPLVDLFEEGDEVLVVAEMPGVGEEDVRLELKEDILTLAAERGEKKYRKEVLLPATFAAEKMSHACRNGVLEIRLRK